MANFYHVFVDHIDGVSVSDVEETLNSEKDWFRYFPGLYVVYSDSDAGAIYDRLEKHVRPGGNAFICKLDVSMKQGWITQKLWDWFKKTR